MYNSSKGEGQNIPLPWPPATSSQGGGILRKVLLQCRHPAIYKTFEKIHHVSSDLEKNAMGSKGPVLCEWTGSLIQFNLPLEDLFSHPPSRYGFFWPTQHSILKNKEIERADEGSLC